jgi:NACHT domain
MHAVPDGIRRISRRLRVPAGIALLAACTWWMLTSGARGTTAAVVLTFTVTVLTCVLAAFGPPGQSARRDQLAEAASRLAREVRRREAAEQHKFLADSGHSRPAELVFRRPKLVRWRSDGTWSQGTSTSIAAFYGHLRRGRLVIVGEAGAGKTVLANQLLLDLLGKPPRGGPIPIRLSLPSFDPRAEPLAPTRLPDQVSKDLDAWIARHLSNVYGLTPTAATALVERGAILPILDGLDEMDPDREPPVRAAAVIRALNAVPRPVVITCRADSYWRLAAAEEGAGREAVLQDAAVVEIQPLTTSQIVAYLTYRFRDPADPRWAERRWHPVINHLIADPTGTLAVTLSSPLRLFLVATAYYARDPAELMRFPDSRSLSRHLLDQLIPATARRYPRSDGTNYQPENVTRWLATIADQLRRRQDLEYGSGSDIELHELWTAAGNRLPRYTSGILHALIAALPLIVAARLAPIARDHALYGWTIGARCSLVILAFVIGFIHPGRRSAGKDYRRGPGRTVNWYFFLPGLIGGLVKGITPALLATAAAHVHARYAVGLATWITIGITSALVFTFDTGGNAISHPGVVLTRGMALELTTPLEGGLAGAAAAVATFPLIGDLRFTEYGWLVLWISFGLAGGAAINGTFSPWLRYLAAASILAFRRGLPARTARFLDWGYTAGLLRLSGAGIQFRHRELQDYLAPAVPDRALPQEPIARR